jgi:hypothetical protein
VNFAPGQNRQERQARRDFRRGEVVRINPDTGVIVVRSGTGREIRETEYRVGKTTKYWGRDRKAINDGLRFNGWRQGSTVWYVPGEGQSVSELWMVDPNQQMADASDAVIEGKIVRVDPVTNRVVIRTKVGPKVEELEYRVDPNTQYWGTDQQQFSTALNYAGFKEGTSIWFRTGPKDRILNEVRFYNPALRRVVKP